jgi:hypothetical protein
VAARYTLYGADMGSDHEAEIRASVGAHDDLGPGYDDAVAEGLVERIGAEIDKRVEAQLRRYSAPYGPYFAPPGPPPLGAQGAAGASGTAEAAGVPGPIGVPGVSGVPGAPQGYPVPSGYPHPGYHGYPGYPGYPGYTGYQAYQAPMPAPGCQAPPPSRPAPRSPGQHSVAMTVIALGSMTLGVATTAIAAHSTNGGGQAVMVLLIWAAIAIINIAYARRC